MSVLEIGTVFAVLPIRIPLIKSFNFSQVRGYISFLNRDECSYALVPANQWNLGEK